MPKNPFAMFLQSDTPGFVHDPFQNLFRNQRLLVHRVVL
jgi:hypothetical protein